jgi:RimJ/RimL family protein N-acetyltransferase
MSKVALKKYDEIYLECFEDNQRANHFYNKMGWEMYKIEVDADMGWNRLFYRKS